MISKRGEELNKSDVPTYKKIMIPLRLPPDVYQKILDKVRKEKEVKRAEFGRL